MPQPYAGGQALDMSDAPGGDFSLDDLFPPEGPDTSPQAQAEPAAPSPEPQAQPVPVEEEFFLKTPTGTVYKTKEDAIKGIAHKDTLIAEYNRNKPVATPTPTPAGPINYAQDPNKFWDDMADAQTKGDKLAFARTLQQFMSDNFAPYVPAVQYGVVQKAFETVSNELPDFRTFHASEDYKNSVEASPVLKQAIEMAENNVQASGQLPELYKLAYMLNLGRKSAEVARTAQAPVREPQAVRPTTTPGTMSREPIANAGAPDITTSEGRKAIIERAKQAGLMDQTWSKLGF